VSIALKELRLAPRTMDVWVVRMATRDDSIERLRAILSADDVCWRQRQQAAVILLPSTSLVAFSLAKWAKWMYTLEVSTAQYLACIGGNSGRSCLGGCSDAWILLSGATSPTGFSAPNDDRSRPASSHITAHGALVGRILVPSGCQGRKAVAISPIRRCTLSP
jgi:hypothetical protein